MFGFLRRKDKPAARAPALSLQAGQVFVNLRPDDRRKIARYIKVVTHGRAALLNPRKAGIKDDQHLAQVIADVERATGILKLNGLDVPTDPVLAEALLKQYAEG